MTIPFSLASYLLVCNLYTKQGAAVPLASMQQGISFVSFCAGCRKVTKALSFTHCLEIGVLQKGFCLSISSQCTQRDCNYLCFGQLDEYLIKSLRQGLGRNSSCRDERCYCVIYCSLV